MLFKQLEQDYVCAYMQHSMPLRSLIPNHKIMEEFGLERTFKGHLVQPLSKWAVEVVHCFRLLSL